MLITLLELKVNGDNNLLLTHVEKLSTVIILHNKVINRELLITRFPCHEVAIRKR